MSNYQDEIKAASKLIANNGTAFEGINPEYAARMRVQNRFQTGIEIARYTPLASCAKTWTEYDADSAQIHTVSWLLARFYRSAKNDRCEKTPRHYK